MRRREACFSKAMIEAINLAFSDFVIIKIDNEQRQGPSQGSISRLMAEGLTPGAADYIIIFDSLLHRDCIFIEVKDPGDNLLKIKRGLQSRKQKEFESRVSKLGFDYILYNDGNIESLVQKLARAGMKRKCA